MVFRKYPHYFNVRRLRKRSTKYIVNELPKTFNDAVYPQLPFLIRENKIKIKCRTNNNPGGQLYNLTWAFTDLFRDERIVVSTMKARELRPHVERLIVEAMRNGDRHRPTMELANFWLREKSLIHKLFKEFVPRYENYASAFTAIHYLGRDYQKYGTPLTDVIEKKIRFEHAGQACLELRGNGLPQILRPNVERSGLLTNVLMNAARHSSAQPSQHKASTTPADTTKPAEPEAETVTAASQQQ